MNNLNTRSPFRGALLLLALLVFGFTAQAQVGGKNSGRSNNTQCCRKLWRTIPPPTATSGQERVAPPAPVSLFGGNKSAAKIEVWVLNAAGQAQDPGKWSLRNEGETMVVDLSALSAGKYTIEMQAGTTLFVYEFDTDGAKTKLLSAWDKVEFLEGAINFCISSGLPVDNCGACMSGGNDCINTPILQRHAVSGVGCSDCQVRKAAPPKPDMKKLAELIKSAPPGETTIYISQCASGELKRIANMSDCPVGCVVMVFERKKR